MSTPQNLHFFLLGDESREGDLVPYFEPARQPLSFVEIVPGADDFELGLGHLFQDNGNGRYQVLNGLIFFDPAQIEHRGFIIFAYGGIEIVDSVVDTAMDDRNIAAGNPAKVVKKLDTTKEMFTRDQYYAFMHSFPSALMDHNNREKLKGNTISGWLRSILSPRKSD